MKKVRLALLSPIIDDPTSWYRGLSPYNLLCKEQGWEIAYPQAQSWASLIGVDVLVMQRPAMPEHFGMLALAKNMGIPVVVDFDDDNLSVPRDNPTFPAYSQMPVKEAILNLARHCDVLTVSTKFLKEKYGIYNKRTEIIPNALPDSLVARRGVLPGARENKFLWRGNASQTRNLSTVAGSIVNLSKKHPDHKFVFFGLEPYDLVERMTNYEIIPPVSLIDYHAILINSHVKCVYYPLHHQDHSQARSHISWLEATYANAVTLAYRNDEFIRPGCLNYSSITEFEDQMTAIAKNEVDVDKAVDNSWQCILENYVLSKTNQLRLQIIQSLLR